MENTDILILTSVMVVLFLVFIIATVREFGEMGNTKYIDKYKPGGPISDFSRLVGNLFSDESISIKKRIILVDAVKNALEVLDKNDEEAKNIEEKK
jgi:hypothetical protein